MASIRVLREEAAKANEIPIPQILEATHALDTVLVGRMALYGEYCVN